jgi:hypothetical protein
MTRASSKIEDAKPRDTMAQPTNSSDMPSLDPKPVFPPDLSTVNTPVLVLGPFTLAIPAGASISISGNTAVITYAGSHISVSAPDADMSHFTIPSRQPKVIEERTGETVSEKVHKSTRKKSKILVSVREEVDHEKARSSISKKIHRVMGEFPNYLLYGIVYSLVFTGLLALTT